MTGRAGVLALQGDVAPHAAALRAAGAAPIEVRCPGSLERCTHLVLPGGESTTLRRLLDLFGLADAIRARVRAGELALFGTCAGTILCAADAGDRPEPLRLLDVDVERNAYGTQLDSFARPLESELFPQLVGVFIRAPRITRVGTGVRVLATDRGDAVLVEAPGILAATFHPELTDDATLHAHFLSMEPSGRNGRG